ncbi:hypothetical protein D3C85_932260 [compost metagenome]
MLAKVGQGLGRADPGQVLRVGYHHQSRILKMPGNECRVGLGAHADRQVVALPDEIDVAIAQVDIDLHPRMALPETGQKREDAVVAIRRWNADAQLAGGFELLAHHFTLRLDQLGQRLPTLLEVGAAAFGEADAAGRPHEQPRAHALLQPRNRSAHCSWSNPGRKCRGREAALLRSQTEELDAAQPDVIEMALHDSLHQVSTDVSEATFIGHESTNTVHPDPMAASSCCPGATHQPSEEAQDAVR